MCRLGISQQWLLYAGLPHLGLLHSLKYSHRNQIDSGLPNLAVLSFSKAQNHTDRVVLWFQSVAFDLHNSLAKTNGTDVRHQYESQTFNL